MGKRQQTERHSRIGLPTRRNHQKCLRLEQTSDQCIVAYAELVTVLTRRHFILDFSLCLRNLNLAPIRTNFLKRGLLQAPPYCRRRIYISSLFVGIVSHHKRRDHHLYDVANDDVRDEDCPQLLLKVVETIV